MATPRTATLSGTVNWSNGNPFDGYVLLVLALPDGYSYACPIGTWPNLVVPIYTRIPITAGAFNQTVSVYYNADLEPPNCRYAAYWYDALDTLISGPSALFDIASSPYAIAIPVLTAPSATVTVPVPASDSATTPAPNVTIPQSLVLDLIADLALKAPLASPVLTGDPQAPTPSPGDNDTSIATTAFVTSAIAALSVAHAFGATVTPSAPTFYFPASAFGGTITGWKIATTTGSAITGTVKVWKKASSVPSAADAINTSGVSITAAADVVSTTLADFTTTTISIGDRLAIHLQSGTDPLTFLLEFK